MSKTENYLGPAQVAEILNVSTETARRLMPEMPGCVNLGRGKNRQLRVPESGLQDWLSNAVVVMPRATGKLARRKHGKLIAV